MIGFQAKMKLQGSVQGGMDENRDLSTEREQLKDLSAKSMFFCGSNVPRPQCKIGPLLDSEFFQVFIYLLSTCRNRSCS